MGSRGKKQRSRKLGSQSIMSNASVPQNINMASTSASSTQAIQQY